MASRNPEEHGAVVIDSCEILQLCECEAECRWARGCQVSPDKYLKIIHLSHIHESLFFYLTLCCELKEDFKMF